MTPPSVSLAPAPGPVRIARPRRPRSRHLRRDLHACTGDGATYSLMVGVGETYLPAFVLAIGLGEVASGLITTVPVVIGSVLQLISPQAVRWFGSNRRWVVLCSVCQALSFLPLAIAALAGAMPLWAVFFVASIYWGSSLATGPAWNSWMESIVPPRLRARYFACRSRLAQCGTLAGFLAGGFALHGGAAATPPLRVFALLFLLAAAFRSASAAFLYWQSEPAPPRAGDHRRVSPWELLRRVGQGADGRLLLYLLCVQTATQVAGPYFTPFMLKSLKFSYGQYALLISVSFATRILVLPALGALAHRYGARTLLWLGGMAIVPMSGGWLVSHDFYYLMFVQVLAGLAWGAYELAMFLMFFETIHPKERVSVLTSFNFANSLAMAAGSLLGAGLLAGLGRTAGVYLTLFGLSSVLRALALVALARVPRYQLAPQSLATRTLGLRATDAPLDQPILPSLSRRSGSR